MKPAPSRLRYLVERPIAPGATLEVAPGVLWLRMPLPIDLDHINLWLLRDGEGWTLVDTGYPADRCAQVWESLLASPLLEGLPLRRVLLTHCHPDHMGLAGWLQQRCGSTVWLAEPGQRLALAFAGALPGAYEHNLAHLLSHGIDEAPALLSSLGAHRGDAATYPGPRYDHAAVDGERIDIGGREWEVIETWGHVDAHQALLCRELGLLISGDHVLPSISPNVSLTFAQQATDPLGDFLHGLRRFESLDGDPLVLPAHGRPFRGLHQRAADLIAHHESELQRLHTGMQMAATPAELVPLLFPGRLKGFQRVLAVQECAAHAEHLVRRGAAERIEGADGRIRFRRSGTLAAENAASRQQDQH